MIFWATKLVGEITYANDQYDCMKLVWGLIVTISLTDKIVALWFADGHWIIFGIYKWLVVRWVIDKLRVTGVMKINTEALAEVFMFHISGHEEFIKLILLLFCFAQRPSFPCDTQKRESVVTGLNWKDLKNFSAVWDFQINSSANKE